MDRFLADCRLLTVAIEFVFELFVLADDSCKTEYGIFRWSVAFLSPRQGYICEQEMPLKAFVAIS